MTRSERIAKALAASTVAAVSTWFFALSALQPWERFQVVPESDVAASVAAVLSLVVAVTCFVRLARGGTPGDELARWGAAGEDGDESADAIDNIEMRPDSGDTSPGNDGTN